MSHHPLRTVGDSTELDYAAFVFDHRMIRYFYLAEIAFLIYDHLLTLDAEVKFVWLPKLRPGTCWFLVVRYIALGANIGVAVYYFSDLDHEEALIETTLSLRVFAMYGLNKWVLVSLLSAFSVMGSVGLWGVRHVWATRKYSTYREWLDAMQYIPLIPSVPGTWEALVVCDILVFALTVRRAYIQRTSSLYQRMATDGSMYFGIIVLANSANVFTFYLGDGLVPGFLSWFTTSLSVTLLSRLMLNLHGAAATGTDTNTLNLNLETVRFTGLGRRTSITDESWSGT
ncbi:hypothetical protein DFH08DRAFT_964065 [Mycena albidolilacea]|uniref:DUF6533 domain-containing protein n=1 Tax=Mycena albidolilacea TaxID=1033008 RepID=A0AAD6ZTD4_9AGAR|nr:hypothetical protein DFH08DRAFT_964065 [Mycena albidolilacea]